MKQILFDCDSTVGIPGKPMDDVLALLYLLGNPDKARILGITCTFANGTAGEVYTSTAQFLREIRRTDIGLYPGAEAGQDPRSRAARFLADTAAAHPGEISLIAIGSMTNLYGAYLLDPGFFGNLKEIILMGGYTAPVLYHGKHLDELNFSVNPGAAACVLNRGKRISILTGNNTLGPSYLPKEEFIQKMGGSYIAEKCGYRFDDQKKRYGNAISYCWDVVAAVYLLHPELFEDHYVHCYITEKGMHSGWLGPTEQAADTCLLNLPKVKNLDTYRREMYTGWLNFPNREEKT